MNIIKYNTIDIVISINLYKSLATLKLQLDTIKKHVLSSYVIILNCNNYMFNLLQNNNILSNNIYINPEIINKNVYEGTILHGIVSNMIYAINNFNFKYFIILSGRTIFYRNITITNLDFFYKKWKNEEEMIQTQKIEFLNMNWWWPIFRKTNLAQYYLNKGYRLHNSEHEGLCFSYNIIKNILNFLVPQLNIMINAFNFKGCIEEFVLQTISYNEFDNSNLEYGFISIGNGIHNEYDINDPNKYTCKINYYND